MTASPGDRDRLTDFLSRYSIPGHGPITPDEARAAADHILELDGLTPDDLQARGYRHLTVVHGDIENPDDEAAQRHLRDWVNRHPAAIRMTRGTGDTTTWLFNPPDADTHVDQLAAIAHEHNPGCWRIRRAPR